MSQFTQRLAAFGRPPRIVALDIARGLAVLGMIAAHTLSLPGEFQFTDPSTWLHLVSGRSAILFAVLAGISISLMTCGQQVPDVADRPHLRYRLLVRGGVITVIGLFLEALSTPVAVILTFYGIVYIASTLFIGLRARYLAMWAGITAVAGPVLVFLLDIIHLNSFYGFGWSTLLDGTYSLSAWLPLTLVGMTIGRIQLTRLKNAATITGIGVLACVIGYGAPALIYTFAPLPGADSGSSWATSDGKYVAVASDDTSFSFSTDRVDDDGVFPGTELSQEDLQTLECDRYADVLSCYETMDDSWSSDDEFFDSYPGDGPGYRNGWVDLFGTLTDSDQWLYLVDYDFLNPSPHSGSLAEIIGSGGFAMIVIGLLLMTGTALRIPLLPIAALGSMPLTAYSAHIMILYLIHGPGGWASGPAVFWPIVILLLIGTTLWALLRGRGPLEELTRYLVNTASPAPVKATAPDGNLPQREGSRPARQKELS